MNILLIKLLSGETVIGKGSEESDGVKIEGPLVIDLVPTNHGLVVLFRPFMVGLKAGVPITIPNDKIVATVSELSLDDGLITQYLQQTSQLAIPKIKTN